jgi:hypothetical protein
MNSTIFLLVHILTSFQKGVAIFENSSNYECYIVHAYASEYILE